MSNTINSHIQNSRFLINEFRISQTDGQVHILNLNDYTLSRKGPRELGYFDDETEKYLSKEYEGPLSVLLKKIKEDNNYNITISDANTIADFLVLLFARNPDILSKTYNQTVIAKGLGITITPSNIVQICKRTDLKNKFFDDHYPVILINNTSTNFISSIKGCAFVMNKETKKTTWYLPLTPKIGIFFVNNEDWKEMFNNATHIDLNDSMFQNYHGEKIYSSILPEGIWGMMDLFDLRIKNSNYLYGFDDKQILRNITSGKYKLTKSSTEYFGYDYLKTIDDINIYQNMNAVDFGTIYKNYKLKYKNLIDE